MGGSDLRVSDVAVMLRFAASDQILESGYGYQAKIMQTRSRSRTRKERALRASLVSPESSDPTGHFSQTDPLNLISYTSFPSLI